MRRKKIGRVVFIELCEMSEAASEWGWAAGKYWKFHPNILPVWQHFANVRKLCKVKNILYSPRTFFESKIILKSQK